MDLFYATSNQSKIYNMRRRLEGSRIHIITPRDLSIQIEVTEDGHNPIENSQKKARAYESALHMTTIAGDSGLLIDDIDPKDQPGIFVRRVNGQTLTNDEMIEHYSGLARKYGGSLRARYVTGLCLIVNGQEHTIEINDDDFIITSTPNSNTCHTGNPLDLVTIEPISGKYYNELTDEEARILTWSFDKKCIQFLKENLDEAGL